MDKVREQLRALAETLNQIEADKQTRFTQLEHVERCVEKARKWRTETVPRSKKDMVRELGDRMCPVLEALLKVLHDQQSRIEVLELTVIERQQSCLAADVEQLFFKEK